MLVVARTLNFISLVCSLTSLFEIIIKRKLKDVPNFLFQFLKAKNVPFNWYFTESCATISVQVFMRFKVANFVNIEFLGHYISECITIGEPSLEVLIVDYVYFIP